MPVTFRDSRLLAIAGYLWLCLVTGCASVWFYAGALEMEMNLQISSHEASVLSYALDQHIVTLRNLLKDGDEVIVPELKDTFKTYIDDMEALLNRIPEV